MCALWSVSDNLFQRVNKCSVHINGLLKPSLDLRFTTRDMCTCVSLWTFKKMLQA